MKNNIIKMYFLKAILWFMVSMPIIVIFFTDEHNLSISQVMILQGIYSITIAFFFTQFPFISSGIPTAATITSASKHSC